MQTSILLVEDDQPIADNVILALEREGLVCQHTALGQNCLDRLQSGPADLVILDVGLPDMNGFELCKAIRRFSDIPIIFLTARSDEIDRIVGLEIGADDYVLKPFSPRELVARVKSILRRHHASAQHADKPPLPHTASPLQLDETRARITCNGHALDLTRAEYCMLAAMMKSPHHVFSREMLLNAASLSEASMERSVDTHIKSLRAKLEKATPDMEPIHTHRGMGYSYSPPP